MNTLQRRTVRFCIICCILILSGAFQRFVSQRAEISSDRTIPESQSVVAGAGGEAPDSLPRVESSIPPPLPAATLTGEAAKAELHKRGQFASLGEAFQAARYAAEKIDPAGAHSRGAEFFAANPKQQLRAWFGKDGIELASGLPPREGAEPWRLKLTLKEVRRADGSARAGRAVSLSSRAVLGEGGRIEIADAMGAITEWYENRSDGIEQGFTLNRRPEGEVGEVSVVLAVDGSLRAGLSLRDDGIRFVDGNGAEVVSFTGLKAWDATGRVLPARMEPRGAMVALVVADAGARYPLMIDPLFANVEARLVEESPAGDEFGRSVALSGNTALVGAPLDDTSGKADAGSAYVFTGSGAGWTRQAKLTASDPSSSNVFGSSVALLGDTALVGTNGRGAYVFVRSGTNWTQQSKLTPMPVGGQVPQIGPAVALGVDTALIGADNDNSTGGTNSGSAYVFIRSGTTWSQQAKLAPDAGSSLAQFGCAVALSGNTALIGARFENTTGGTFAGSAYVFVRSGTTWIRQERLTASDGGTFDGFGEAVALDADTVLIGSSNDETSPGLRTGSAFVFTRSGVTWSEQQKLTASAPQVSARFGTSVALSGNTALVGAAGDGNSSAGKAYVFTRSGTLWGQQAVLAAGEPATVDLFGNAVALSGDTALVCAFRDDNLGGVDAGISYVFTRSGTIWSQQATLTASDGAGGDSIGTSVALTGDTALVGAPSDDATAGLNVGSAYVFVRSGTSWSQQAKLMADDGAQDDQFGISAALSGNTALIGAFRNDTPDGVDSGSVYVFVRNGVNWSQQQMLTPGSGTTNDYFGSAVALSGETALIGAQQQFVATGTTAGSAYVFVRSGTVWTMQAKLAGDDVTGVFGKSVALDGDTALVGAPFDNTAGGTDAGSAYVFIRSGMVWNRQERFIAGDGAANDRFGISVALSGDTALVGAYNDDTTRGINAGSAYVFIRSGPVWNQQAKLVSLDGAGGGVFGVSVALSGDTALVGASADNTTAGSNTGSAYVFTRIGTTWNQQVKLTSGVDASSADEFGGAVALIGNSALVGAAKDDTAGNDAGSAYVFQLGELPEIAKQPLSRTVVPGVPVTFDVSATGYAPMQYQWRKEGSEIAGANTPSYTIPSVQVADGGGYDCVVSNIGGVVTSATAVLQVNALSEFTQLAPAPLDPRGQAQGFIVVNLSPDNLTGRGWRFVGEQAWRAAGVPAGGLATGNREIEFRPVPGFLHPLREPVSIVSGAATVVGREYFQSAGAGTGAMSITLLPAALAGAQWRLLGEGDSAWRASGATLAGLAAGVYLVECEDVAGYTTPQPLSVVVSNGQTRSATATYFLADAPLGAQPGVVGFDAISAAAPNPYTFVGQLRNDAGAGTGFVVRQRVVATAAHVVFDDGTLSAATGLQWLFQRERGTYEPVPQIPRGSYILTGYAAARMGAVPGQSTSTSQNNDVAAVWFYEADENGNPLDPLAGRGGFAGFLASGAVDNEWLLSPRLKTLVGYPLDGIAPQNQGRMHATPPVNVSFTRAPDIITQAGTITSRVYLTDGVTSRGGNSGGPVMVQYDDGNYFPAAIYLGGTTQTRVRVIDPDVITIFDSAELSGTSGNNNTNGGISQTNTALGATPSGTLRVVIEPAAARAADAAWRIGAGAFSSSGQTKPYLSPGNYTLSFKSVEGFTAPAARGITVAAGAGTFITVNYAPAGTTPAAAASSPTYVSLLTGPDAAAGLATLSVTKANRFTLTVRLDVTKLRLAGNFDGSGAFTGQITRPGKTPVSVTLSFDRELVPQLSGTITVDGVAFALGGGRSPFNAKNPADAAGTHTLALPHDAAFSDPATEPFGDGYALLTVTRDGKARAVGKLGDNTAFAASAPVFADATIPIFAQPYAARGLLAGTLAFHDEPAADIDHLDGTLRWQKPATARGRYAAGFTGSIATLGSRWTPPARGIAALDITGWDLEIGAGVLAPPLTATTTLSVKNAFTLTGTTGIKLTLAPATGQLGGSFPGPNSRSASFKGALLQRQRIGMGVFGLPDKTGPVTLDPP